MMLNAMRDYVSIPGTIDDVKRSQRTRLSMRGNKQNLEAAKHERQFINSVLKSFRPLMYIEVSRFLGFSL